MDVHIRQVTHQFGATPVLRNISLHVADRELFFLLGPSGCGKTTLLRLIAGFYQPASGEVRFGDRLMKTVEPHRRNTGMVFQNYALWPHLTVAENVVYGLEVRGLPAPERRARVAEALRIVRMEPFADRKPNQLSGGQQQRVALARALVIRPDVLLLDEPLSNLDAQLRLEMRDEIRRIHDETRITTIYVTHDQKEALSMADRLAVLRDGVIEQVDDPRSMYRRPATRFVADFIGETNWLEGTVESLSPREAVIGTPAGRFFVASSQGVSAAGETVRVGFRPESIRFGRGPENNLTGLVRSVTYLGETEQYILETTPGGAFRASEQDPATVRPVGTQVEFHVPRASLFLVRPG